MSWSHSVSATTSRSGLYLDYPSALNGTRTAITTAIIAHIRSTRHFVKYEKKISCNVSSFLATICSKPITFSFRPWAFSIRTVDRLLHRAKSAGTAAEGFYQHSVEFFSNEAEEDGRKRNTRPLPLRTWKTWRSILYTATQAQKSL